MTQKKKTGMWLRPVVHAQSKHSGWFLNTAVELAVYAVFILTVSELTGFAELYAPWVMLLTGIYLCVMHGILIRFQRQSWFGIAVLVLLLAFVIVCGEQIREGVRLFWNQLGDTWTAGTGWVLPELETQLAGQEGESCLIVFSIFAGGLSALICCALVTYAAPLMAVIMPGLLFAGTAVMGADISVKLLVPVLAASFLLLLYSGKGKKNTALPVIMSSLICIAFSGVIASGMWALNANDWAATVSEQLHSEAHTRRYETKYTTLPEGDFTDFQIQSAQTQAALVVNMEKPETLYLRGFTGAAFEDNVWEPLDTQLLAENKDLLYWLNLNEFNPAAQFEAAALTAVETNTVTIQNIGACSRYLYVPFNLCAGEQLDPEDLNTDSIASDGGRIYMYNVVSGGAEMISMILENLQTSDDADVLSFRKAESAYRGFVYENYLQIPQEIEDLLGEQWDAAAHQYGNAGNLTVNQAQACVRTFLSRCFPENGEQNELELPLSMAEGTSYQYATVAALTLRYFGIPSRYVEGYVITEEMAGSVQNGDPITVDSSCACAWVEVYQDGIGWIPMDLTPGLGESGQSSAGGSNNEEKQPGAKIPDVSEGQELEEEPVDDASEPEPDGGYVVTLPGVVSWELLLILLLIFLLILGLAIRRKVILARKEKKFQSGSINDAVAWIFADTAYILEKMGLDRGNGSMRELCEPAGQRFGAEYADKLKDMVSLNAQAMFSSRELDQKQRDAVLEFRNDTILHLRAGIKWYRRVWMKWIQCLY